MGARAGLCRRPRAACTSIISVDMDDEDGRCLLDVICDPQALNDFLHGSESQLDSDDLLGGSGDPAGSFFVGSVHHIQEPRSSTHLLASEPSATAGASVDLDFLEDDDILGSPQGGGGPGSDQPCDILQQSLAEANITEQSLQEAEEELDLGAFGLPSLPEGTPLPPPAPAPAQLFQGLPPLATPQGLVNKAINVQPFMQHMGLGNVTLQSLQGLQALPNGGPGVGVGGPLSGPLGISQIQVVGQQVMAIHQSGQPILAKSMGGYQLAPQHCAPQPPDSLQALQGKPPGGALNGGFGNGPGPPPSQGGATATVQCGSVLQPQNIVIQRTPTPIQPKPPTGGVIQPKIYQLSPKTSFSAGGAGPGGQASTQGAVPLSALQGEVGQKHQQQQQQQQQQQNVAFVAGKPGQQNLVLSTPGGAFPQALSASMFKHHQGLQQQQQSQQQQQLNKPLSLHLLNQTGSIVIPSQAMLQGQGSFLLPPHLSSALQGGGQILAQHPGGGHIITSQGPGGQLIANQILSNHQGLAGQLNLGQMLASQGPQGHIQLSGPIQLQGGGQVGAHTLFQMPVSLAGGSLQTQTQSGGAVIQAVPSPALTVLNQSPEPSSQTLVSRQQQHQRSDSGLAGLMTSSSNEQQSQPPPPPPPPPLPPSILTVQTSSGTPSPSPSSSSAVALSSSSTSSSSSQPLQISAVHLQQHQPPSLHSPGQIIISQQGAGMVLSQESVQRFLQQQQQALFQAAEKGVSPASSCVPASVIVSSSSDPSPSSRESLSAEARPGQVSASSFGSPHTLVYQISSTAQQQQQSKPLGASPSNTLPHPPSGSNSPQLPPLILGQMHSPHPSRPPSRPPSQPQPLSRPPSEPPLPRSCTPSQPPLFIIQNHPGGSPQPQPQQQQQQQQQGGVTGPPSSAQSPVMRPHSQSPYQLPPASQPERRTMGSPQPLHLQSPESRAGLAVPMGHYQFHFQQPAQQPMQQQQQQQSPGLGLQAQPPAAPPPMQTLHLTAEQQQNLQLVGAQLQTLSTIAQPSLQQRQLLDKLLQIQHNIILQAKQQTLSSSQVLSRSGLTQFSSNPQTSVLVSQQAPPPVSIAPPSSQAKPPPPQPDPAHSAAVTSQGAGPPAQLASLLQQTSVVVKTPGTGSGVSPAMQSEGKSFPSGGVQIKQGELLPVPQTVQGQPGVISSVGGLSVSKGELQMQVLGAGVPQILHTASMQTQPQSQLGSVTRPFSAPPSKEARMLEQLRRQQGAVLHPDYQSPFSTFGDALQRLLPYHLYQGTPSSGKDYTRVDEEFESVSVQLLKRTQAMLNKYRLLLFEESRRQGPSAEMVMIDRMFIQEEKTALSQDKVLVKERPDEYVLPSCVTQGLSTSSSSSCPRPPASSNSPSSSATAPPLITPTKLVIKHAGGASPSVSWARATPPPSVTSSPGGGDADSLPSRSSRPPMKTYEARRRIGLKLKIKQEAGLSKVVHNTALDPVHTPPSTPKTHAPGSTVIQTLGNVTVPGPGPLPSQPFPPTVSTATGTPTVITANQVNGTPGHPADRKQPTPTSCRLPLRKTYRENVCPAGAEQKWGGGAGGGHFGGPPLPQNTPPTTPTSTTTATTVTPQQRATLPRRPQTQQQALLEEEEEEEEGEVERGRTVIARVRLEKKGRSPRHEAVIFGKDRERAIPKQEELKQLSGAEEEFYRGAIKQEPPDHYSPGGGLLNTHPGFSGPARARGAGLGGSPEGEGGGSSWDSPFPSAAKRRKLESLDVDNASFSSGSPPQDDSLNEHLQTAIDSILNLQQGQGPPRPQPGPCRGPSNTHRQQQQQQQPAADPTYPPRSRNGGVGKARTYSR